MTLLFIVFFFCSTDLFCVGVFNELSLCITFAPIRNRWKVLLFYYELTLNSGVRGESPTEAELRAKEVVSFPVQLHRT